MVIHQFRPITGGAELQAERLSARLVELGHSMQIFTELRTPNTPKDEILNGVYIHRVNFKMAYDAELKTAAVDTFRFLYENRNSYDIIHAHQAFGHAMVSVVVAKITGKASIIKVACSGEVGDINVFSKFPGAQSALKVLKQADCVVALSKEVENELLDAGFSAARIARIPNGVDTDLFKRRKGFRSQGPFQFILIGRKTPQKGIDVALRAVKMLMDRGLTHFRLVLRGREDPSQNYPLMAQALGVEQLVEFLPFTDAVLDFYHDAHCLILPSRSEGMSNTLLEAMSLEIPVIASDVSGASEIINDNIDGILIPPEAPEALANAMQKIMKKTDLAVKMGQQARLKVANNFSLQSVAQKYSELYNHLYRRVRL